MDENLAWFVRIVIFGIGCSIVWGLCGYSIGKKDADRWWEKDRGLLVTPVPEPNFDALRIVPSCDGPQHIVIKNVDLWMNPKTEK